jgi:hypothetical protein
MVVRRYFHIDIDLIAKQMATSKMMKLITKFPQEFATTTWKANFIFWPSDRQLIQKKHMKLLGPMDLIILSLECQGFSTVRFGEGLSVATPHLEECEDDTHTPEMGTWEFSGTLKTSKFDYKGQNTLP